MVLSTTCNRQEINLLLIGIITDPYYWLKPKLLFGIYNLGVLPRCVGATAIGFKVENRQPTNFHHYQIVIDHVLSHELTTTGYLRNLNCESHILADSFLSSTGGFKNFYFSEINLSSTLRCLKISFFDNQPSVSIAPFKALSTPCFIFLNQPFLRCLRRLFDSRAGKFTARFDAVNSRPNFSRSFFTAMFPAVTSPQETGNLSQLFGPSTWAE